MPDSSTRIKSLLGLSISPTRAARESIVDRLAARLAIDPTPYDTALIEQRRRLIVDELGAAVRLTGGHLNPFPTGSDAQGAPVDLDSRHGGRPHRIVFSLYGSKGRKLGAVTVNDVLGATPIVGVEVGRNLLDPVALLDAPARFELAVALGEAVRAAK
jgi:hypothetical protein